MISKKQHQLTLACEDEVHLWHLLQQHLSRKTRDSIIRLLEIADESVSAADCGLNRETRSKWIKRYSSRPALAAFFNRADCEADFLSDLDKAGTRLRCEPISEIAKELGISVSRLETIAEEVSLPIPRQKDLDFNFDFIVNRRVLEKNIVGIGGVLITAETCVICLAIRGSSSFLDRMRDAQRRWQHEAPEWTATAVEDVFARSFFKDLKNAAINREDVGAYQARLSAWKKEVCAAFPTGWELEFFNEELLVDDYSECIEKRIFRIRNGLGSMNAFPSFRWWAERMRREDWQGTGGLVGSLKQLLLDGHLTTLGGRYWATQGHVFGLNRSTSVALQARHFHRCKILDLAPRVEVSAQEGEIGMTVVPYPGCRHFVEALGMPDPHDIERAAKERLRLTSEFSDVVFVDGLEGSAARDHFNRWLDAPFIFDQDQRTNSARNDIPFCGWKCRLLPRRLIFPSSQNPQVKRLDEALAAIESCGSGRRISEN